MKREEMNDSIKASGDVIEKNEDLSSDAVNIDHKRKSENGKGVLRKTLLIGFLLISCVGLVYAGVKTMENRNLNNDQGEVLENLENEDTNDNHHFDSHMTREELFRYGDELSSSQEWANKSFVVIDTEVGYPSGIDVRPNSDHIREYSELDDDLLILPEVLGDYKFSNLSIHYYADFPGEDVIDAMIEDNNEERFIVKEIETGAVRGMSYFYNSVEGDLTMTIKLDFEEESLFTGNLEDLEVINIDDVDVFITESDYMGVRYGPVKIIKIKGVNHFKTTWFDADHKIKVDVNPNLINSGNEIEEEVNGERILTITYPENTKEALISFTELLHEALKSLD